jgi:benzoate-CoA ligase
MLKVGGIWVSPIEVEACIIGHPAVLGCAVVPGRDDENLVKPSAYVVLNKGVEPTLALETEIKEFVKGELAHYKFPRWVHFVSDLPKTATGKVKRFELKQLEEQACLNFLRCKQIKSRHTQTPVSFLLKDQMQTRYF